MKTRSGAHAVRGGFSLMELMLVLIILGVLGAVAAYNFAGAGERARIRATKHSLGVLKQLIQNYHMDNQSTYPPTISTLVSAKYLEAGHDKDGFGRAFYYKPGIANPERPFDLISPGPDGQLGNADDINVWTMDTTH